MTLLYTSPIFLEHDTGRHPERRQRLEQILAQLRRNGLLDRCKTPDWQPASPSRLERIHDPHYVDYVRKFAASGGGRIEADTLVSPRSFDAASLAAGAAGDAVERVVCGDDRRALCLVRPPGHHALPEEAMGFCLFNNVAVAAAVATEEFGLDRVLIVDFDVHHGNGTQHSFWTNERIAFLSVHRWPFYPGTGAANETGSGPGLGATRNLPIEFGAARSEYLKIFADELHDFADRVRPQLVIASAGFDSHAADPVGSLGLETEDFEPITDAVLDVADEHAGGRLVSVLEGGYNASALAGCVELHLLRMLHREQNETAPN